MLPKRIKILSTIKDFITFRMRLVHTYCPHLYRNQNEKLFNKQYELIKS